MTDKIIELIKKGYSVDICPDVCPGSMHIALRKYDPETKNWYKANMALSYDLYGTYYTQSIDERIVWVLDHLEEQMKRYKYMVKKESKNNAEN